MKEYNQNLEENHNVTKHGEFVTTYFSWLPLDKQKENANRFDKITKKKREK